MGLADNGPPLIKDSLESCGGSRAVASCRQSFAG